MKTKSYFYKKFFDKILGINGVVWLMDVDSTVLALEDVWIEKYNEDNNDNLKKERVRTWDIGRYTKIGDGMYDYLYLPDLYKNVQPVPFALEAIERIRSFPSNRIIYSTHVVGHPGQKWERLNELGFIKEGDAYFEGFAPPKSSIDKNVFLSHIMVDDNYHHIKKYAGSMGLLFTQPWNEDEEYSPRIKNWEDFLEKTKDL